MSCGSHWIRCPSLNKWFLPGKFRALTGQTRIIWPLLVVECELNSVQALKLRARGTVVPLRKRQWMWDGKKKNKEFLSCQSQPLRSWWMCVVELQTRSSLATGAFDFIYDRQMISSFLVPQYIFFFLQQNLMSACFVTCEQHRLY